MRLSVEPKTPPTQPGKLVCVRQEVAGEKRGKTTKEVSAALPVASLRSARPGKLEHWEIQQF
jgi:hypothetical protein